MLADGAVAWSPRHEALYGRYVRVELFLGAIVLLAVFFMARSLGARKPACQGWT